jgi:hypothetical protein
MPGAVAPFPTSIDALSDHQVETALLGIAGHIAAAQCRFLQYLAEFDARKLWAACDGVTSCAHWVSWKIGMNIRTANEHLRIARALRKLPVVTAAFAAGELTYSKVRAISRVIGDDTSTLVRIAQQLADGTSNLPNTRVADPEAAERVLLAIARYGTAAHLERLIHATRQLITPPQNQAARRSLSWRWADDGTLELRARLTPEEGARLIAEIEARTPKRTPTAPDLAPQPADLVERAREQEPGLVADGIAARRADALMALVTGRTEDGKVVERGHAEVIVHVDASTGTARLDGGPALAPATARRLACDAKVQLLLDDRAGNRMYLGRSHRLASDAQVRALTARDGERCQFPGCPHTRYLNAHHIIPWQAGGPTDIDNLIMICTYHHTVVHDHGYRIHRVNGRWEFRRPDGTPVPEAAEPLSGKAESLVEMHTRAGLHINHTTIKTKWQGDSLDIDYVLGLLLLPKRIPAAA